MSNRILRVDVHDHSLIPAEAEIWITVIPERQTPATEVRGRLTGPRCPYATTVEVAYPLRPFPRRPAGLTGLPMRVVIPEASLWDPESPFLYEGTVELWQDGQRCDQVRISHGLRLLQCGRRGLRLNGRPFVLQGIAAPGGSKADVARWRQAGYNLFVAPVGRSELWPPADRLGMLLLGRLPPGNADALAQAAALSDHACCFGCLVDQETAEDRSRWQDVLARLTGAKRPLLGMEVEHAPSTPLPEELSFLVWTGQGTPLLEGTEIPFLIRRGEAIDPAGVPPASSLPPGVLGWIDQEITLPRRDGSP